MKRKKTKIKASPTKKLKPHHAKPYRKRHYGLLIASVLLALALLVVLVSDRFSKQSAQNDAKDLISQLISKEGEVSPVATIGSTHGFSITYNQNKLYAGAIDSDTEKVYMDGELSTNRAYSLVRLSQDIPTSTPAELSAVEPGSIIFRYYPDLKSSSSTDLRDLEKDLVESINEDFVLQNSTETKLDSQNFLASSWEVKLADGIGSSLGAKLTTYAGILNERPLIITISSSLVSNPSESAAIGEALNSIKFGQPEAPISATSPKKSFVSTSGGSFGERLLDKITLTQSTSAAPEVVQPNSSEKTSTLYGPAVVKIYNLYCMDITISGQPFLQDVCKGATGSGFMVGGSGYVVTNGHVAVNNPLDIAIEGSIKALNQGNETLFNELVRESGLSEFDLLGAKNERERAAIILDKFYSIPKDTFVSTNGVENLLVGLGEEQPDIEGLMTLTEARQKYAEKETIKQAVVTAEDYRAFDGAFTGQFKSSDVALLKMEGSNYPSVKIGNINSLSQGSGLSIIGFPGAAGTNDLVESTQSRATLTSGKVSAIKSASGSDNQLIETDATIGHGNSGGPAFNDSGEVVGIATYTIDGSGEGDGVFNYIRDIADLTALASKNSININEASPTQQAWEQGINFFYEGRYSKAVKSFGEVKSLYPQHTKVDQFTNLAQQKIDAGEEIKDFPTIIFIAAGGLSALLLVGACFMIIRHKKKHQMFLQQGSLNLPQNSSAPTSGPPQDTLPMTNSTPDQQPPKFDLPTNDVR